MAAARRSSSSSRRCESAGAGRASASRSFALRLLFFAFGRFILRFFGGSERKGGRGMMTFMTIIFEGVEKDDDGMIFFVFNHSLF
jgi:hypothetical protein